MLGEQDSCSLAVHHVVKEGNKNFTCEIALYGIRCKYIKLRAGLECVDKCRKYAAGRERGWQSTLGGIGGRPRWWGLGALKSQDRKVRRAQGRQRSLQVSGLRAHVLLRRVGAGDLRSPLALTSGALCCWSMNEVLEQKDRYQREAASWGGWFLLVGRGWKIGELNGAAQRPRACVWLCTVWRGQLERSCSRSAFLPTRLYLEWYE